MFKGFNRRVLNTERSGLYSLARFEALEPRVLFSATLLETALQDCHCDPSGAELHVLPPVDLDKAAATQAATADVSETPYLGLEPLSQTFFLNSNPGASQTIYLDFDGHTTSGTTWNNNFNGGSDFYTPAYSFEGDASFSNNELTRIQYIWQRVAEDFMPFDVNVTTQDPGLDALIKTNSSDPIWGVRVVIGGSSYDWYGAGAGGVAYVGSFNWNTDAPTYVFPSQLGNGNEKYVAEATSHEAGHTLGLRHDGAAGTSYYSGHGSGETAWAPIMGVGYYNNLVQWSKGEYTSANNKEDDLNIITTQNGFSYRADDFGGTIGSASALTLAGTSVSATGLIERNTDFDVFSFTTGAGSVALNINPALRGANLDILAELLDSSGSVIATSNPVDALAASFNENLAAGTYYLRISGTGKGDPSSDGYSDYGSLGQYSISGTVEPPYAGPTLSIDDISIDEGGGWGYFTVTLSEPSATQVTVDASISDITTTAGVDYRIRSETLVFNPGQTTQTFGVSMINDLVNEGDETFAVNLSNAVGAEISDGQGIGTIIDNDAPPVILRIFSRSRTEPDAKGNGQPKIGVMSFSLTLSEAKTVPVSVDWTTADGTALAGLDYTAASGTLVIDPGQTSATIDIDIIGDNDIEDDEDFYVLLSNVANATLTTDTATGTIIDNDTNGPGNGNGKGPNKAPEAGASDYLRLAAYFDYTEGQADDSDDPTPEPSAELVASVFDTNLERLLS